MNFQIRSIQMKIALWTGLCLLAAAGILAAYAVVTLRSVMIQAAKDQAAAQASSQAGIIDAQVEAALDTARTLAQAFSAVESSGINISREQANAMLKQVLEDNPQFLGISTAWEPDAFDGRDKNYVNMMGHDETGRFIPYWARSGEEIALSPLLDYEVEGTGDYYLIPKRTKQEAIIDPYVYPIDGQDVLMTSLMAPVVVDGEFYGVVGVDIRLDFLQEMADSAEIFDGAGQMVLISNNGSLAGVTGEPELIGKNLEELQEDWEQDLAVVQEGERLLEEDEGNIEVYEPIQIGETATPWSVNINIPIDRITAQATQMMWRMIWIGVALMLIGQTLIWYAALQIARPLKKLTAAAQSLARGSLTQGLDFRQKDEVGQLSRAFGEMTRALILKTETAEKIAGGDLTVVVPVASEEDRLGQAMAGMVAGLREQVSQVAENAASLKTASAEMAASAHQAGQATNQIAATVQQIARGASQQSESISRTAANAEQMSRAITGVARGAQEQAASIARTAHVTAKINETIQKITGTAQASARDSASATQAARDGTQTVQETMECMGSIKAKVGQSVQKVREMGDRSEQIGIIVEVIEDIASQTNLLALNAAIEAARAGEHGKGFAVVADEVRKLAERAAASTKEISGLVKGIQGTVTEAVGAMDESASEVEQGVAKADDSGQALSLILKAAEAVTQQAGAVLGATQQMQALADELVSATDSVSAVVEENTASAEEMSASSSEVTQAIENIASVSEENSAAIEEVSASAEEMSAQVEEVTVSARSLAEMAAALEQIVAQFRLTTGVKAENGRSPRGVEAPVKRAAVLPEPAFEP